MHSTPSPCARQKSRTARTTSAPDPVNAGRSLDAHTTIPAAPATVVAAPSARFGVTTLFPASPSAQASRSVAHDSTAQPRTSALAVAMLSAGNAGRYDGDTSR